MRLKCTIFLGKRVCFEGGVARTNSGWLRGRKCPPYTIVGLEAYITHAGSSDISVGLGGKWRKGKRPDRLEDSTQLRTPFYPYFPYHVWTHPRWPRILCRASPEVIQTCRSATTDQSTILWKHPWHTERRWRAQQAPTDASRRNRRYINLWTRKRLRDDGPL